MSTRRPAADVVRTLRETQTPHDDYAVEQTGASTIAITGPTDSALTLPPSLLALALELGYAVESVTVGGKTGRSVTLLGPRN
jgi:hypothetical protein